MTWFFVALVILMGITIAGIPAMSRPTVPLGIAVPSTHVDHPVVRTARRRHAVITLLATALVALATALVPLPIVAQSLSSLAILVIGFVVMVLARRPIVAAKSAEGWYDGVRVGVAASPVSRSTAGPMPGQRSFVISLVICGLIMVAAAVIGILAYPTLPDPVPMQFAADGTVNTYAAKSWWIVTVPLLALAVTVLLLTLLGIVIRRTARRQLPDGSGDLGRREAAERTGLQLALLGWSALVVAWSFAASSLLFWFGMAPRVVQLVVLATLVATVGLIAAIVVAAVRMRRRVADHATPGDTETPDDDAHWHLAGQVYVNRNDPAWMVPKRVGIGTTVNLGHPGGIAFLVGILAFSAAIVIVSFTLAL